MSPLADDVNNTVENLVTGQGSTPLPVPDPETRELAEVAAELRLMPDPEFKEKLKAQLAGAAASTSTSARIVEISKSPANDYADILPTLFHTQSNYPIHGKNFAISFVAQSALVAILASTGYWVTQHRQEIKQQVMALVTDESPYVLPASRTQAGGGGGGGDRDKLQASKGTPPKFAMEQMTPPVVVVRNENPKLTADPTLLGPPQLTLPQSPQMGDPMSAILSPLSNGTGSGGGIGTGTGTGIGSGYGGGLGPGSGGGMGGGVFRVGGGVSAPRAIYAPDPEFSEEARKAKYQGTVVLRLIVGPDGRTRDIHILKTLGLGLDEKAIEAVSRWRFDPALKDGRPVSVMVSVEVSFRLY